MNTNCNDKVIQDTVTETGEGKALIQHVISHHTGFLAGKIKEGTFESMRILNFGLFRPKIREVQYKQLYKSMPEGFKKLIRER